MVVGTLVVGAATAQFAPSCPAAEHHYHVRLDTTLETLSVRASVPGARALRTRDPRGVDALRARRRCDGRPIRIVRGALTTRAAPFECIEYTVDLSSIDGRAGWHRIDLAEDVAWTRITRWLWRAPGEDIELSVTFELPNGVSVAVPWERAGADHRYRVPESPESDAAISVFGRFLRRPVSETGLSYVLLPPATGPVDPAPISAWLAGAVAQIETAYGRFPNPEVQIVVVPVTPGAPDTSPVPWAHVVRDGGEAVQFFVDMARPLSDLLADWTATHEFAHLMLPYLAPADKWISEGFASYYQNVMMARGGQYTEAHAWTELRRCFDRARGEAPERTPPEAVSAGVGEARMMIYWSGAALALIADVELRRASGGAMSLDRVLGAFAAEALPSPERWSAADFFSRLDALAGTRIFTRLLRRFESTAGIEDLSALWAELGVRGGADTGQVELVDAPDAAIRRRIMGAHSER